MASNLDELSLDLTIEDFLVRLRSKTIRALKPKPRTPRPLPLTFKPPPRKSKPQIEPVSPSMNLVTRLTCPSRKSHVTRHTALSSRVQVIRRTLTPNSKFQLQRRHPPC